MRRDIGNEVVVAVVAIGLIAFAVIFGIVLSLSSTGPAGTVLEPTATRAAVAQNATATGVETAEATSEPTDSTQSVVNTQSAPTEATGTSETAATEESTLTQPPASETPATTGP